MKTINLGIIGLGTVGKSFVKLIKQQESFLQQSLKAKIIIYGISARTSESLNHVDAILKTKNALDICRHEEIDIVVELAGGYESPREWVLESLKHNKHVITANKALLAKYGHELFPLAEKQGCSIFFEAAIGGAIPVIRSIQDLMSGNKIHSFTCIINGTCNYILTQMKNLKQSFDFVLKEAQEKGYAEADPSLDIEATDTAHKVALLSSLVSQKYVSFKDIFVKGITKVTTLDLDMATEFGFSIKLLGQFITQPSGQIYITVFPTLVPAKHQLSSVNGVLNAVYYENSAAGPIFLTGAGAGGDVTASAVMSDLTQACLSHLSKQKMTNSLGFINPSNSIDILPIDTFETEFYLRIITKDESGAFASISKILSQNNVSIEAVIQKPSQGTFTPIIIRTHKVSHQAIKIAITEIDRLKIVIEDSLFLHFY